MSKIQNFYAGQKVFITGGTGFLGKVLVEKLLRSTDVTTIYFLIRTKKGKSACERLHLTFSNKFFDKLREERPNFFQKIVPIIGDFTQPGIGLSWEDRAELVANVNVIFHAAANVRFDENLKNAYLTNFESTRVLTQLCKESKNLKAFVYVSTIFGNFHRDTIEEEIYDHPVNYDELGKELKELSEEEVEELTPEIIGSYINTYVFTKTMSESLIKKELANLPVGIFRPGIVVSTYEEPIPGWISSWSALTQVTITVGLGMTRIVHINKNLPVELAPVDTCIAALIAAAWDISNKVTHDPIPVYNFTSSVENRITYKEYFDNCIPYFSSHPPFNMIWTPRINYATNRAHYLMMWLLMQWLPSFFVNLIFKVFGRESKMLRVCIKINEVIGTTTKFTMKREVKTGTVQALWTKLEEEDRILFPMSIADVSWPNFFETYWPGLRLYMLKQKDDSLEMARIRYKRLEVAHQLLKLLLLIALMVLVILYL